MTRISRRTLLLGTGSALVSAATLRSGVFGGGGGPGWPPVVYSTDLNHPSGDLDDWIDLAVAHGLGLDVRALVLDQHQSVSGSGFPPVAMMSRITGTRWLANDGLRSPVPTMQSRELGASDADAVAVIIEALESAERPVTIVIVGSCRDVAVAYNRAPALFHARVGRLVIFAGDASAVGFVENNVALDPLAFLRLMGSGLPVRWVPCFDGGLWQAGTRSSYVSTEQRPVFPANLPAPLLRYFAYRLRLATSDPEAWVGQPLTPDDWAVLHSGTRNLWVAALLALVRGDGSFEWGGVTAGVCEPVSVRFALTGALDPSGPVGAHVDCWRVLDPPKWREAMVAATVDALRRVPVVI